MSHAHCAADDDPLIFEYALRFPDGMYYTKDVPGDRGSWAKAYTYSIRGAYRLKDENPNLFKDCIVERIL